MKLSIPHINKTDIHNVSNTKKWLGFNFIKNNKFI